MTGGGSPWRDLGNTDRGSFAAAVSRTWDGRGVSPMAGEAAAVWEAVSQAGLARLAAAVLWMERKNDSWKRDYGLDATFRNPFAMKERRDGSGGWARYGSYRAAAADWAARLLDPSGPYARTATVAELVHVYAPGSDGNDEARYVAVIAAEVDRLPFEGPGPAVPAEPTLDPWRPYPWPAMVRMIVPKPWEGAGFDRCAFRRPLVRGFCTHITDGGGTIEGIRDLFATGGQRQGDALTDLVIGRDGRIGLLNDWRDPNWGGTRAGWANGGVDGLEGDGVAYYRKFPDINVNLVSCEHIATAGQAWTDAMIAASIEVRTALMQELRVPASSYPVRPEWGVSSEQQHRNFATKSCPAEPYISTVSKVVLREVRARLAAWQGSGAGDAPEVPAPAATLTKWGLSLEHVADLWGSMTRVNGDGTSDELPFNPDGALSLLWLARCEREGRFPEAESIRIYDARLAAGRERFATWEGGWTAWLPVDNQRAGWRWLDETPAAAGVAA